MSYQFEKEESAKTKAQLLNRDGVVSAFWHTLAGINGSQSSADVIVGGLSYLYDIVGWEVKPETIVRTVSEDVREN